MRFVVTNLERSMSAGIQDVYERLYCHRGEMENKLKQQKLDLDAGRTSSSWMRVESVALVFFPHSPMCCWITLRRLGLRNTSQRRAYVGTIRLRYLKIAARVKVTARRVWLSFSEAYPWKSEFDAIGPQSQRLAKPCSCTAGLSRRSIQSDRIEHSPNRPAPG